MEIKGHYKDVQKIRGRKKSLLWYGNIIENPYQKKSINFA